MEIPYNSTPRPDTGLYNAKVGIWLFLASEVMLFGALFSSYILLRVGADPGAWHHRPLNIPLGTLNTFILIISSITVLMSWASLKMNSLEGFRKYMGITLLCSVAFLVIKSFEYYAKFSHGIFPKTDTYYAIYFTLTGLHALHVIGGALVNLYLWGPGIKMWKTDPERFTNRVEVSGLLWHFVDLVWIFLFPVLYLL